jgi:hypothetical protein
MQGYQVRLLSINLNQPWNGIREDLLSKLGCGIPPYRNDCLPVSPISWIQKMLGCAEAGFDAIHAIPLKAAISRSIFAVSEGCFAMMMALPQGSARALPTVQAIMV